MNETTTRGPVASRVGTRISGRYECIDLLGHGASGIVYRALDHELDAMQVAIKFLHPHMITNEGTVERFRKEVLVARRLSHPNIVNVYEFNLTTDKQFYIVMEYVQGMSLAGLLSSMPGRRLQFEHAVQIMYQISAALAHAHSQRIVHRDIKPENVMLDADGRVKICDFGLARGIEDRSHLTRTGASVGTPTYMAPEQFLGERADERSDVYAMSIVGYELVSGFVPFTDDNYLKLAEKHLQEPLPPFPRELDLPSWYWDLLRTAASKEKSDRYSSALPMRDILQNYLDEESVARCEELIRNWDSYEERRLKRRRQKRLRYFSRSLSFVFLGVLLTLVSISLYLDRQWWHIGKYVLEAERIVGSVPVAPLKLLMGISTSTDDESFRRFLLEKLSQPISSDYKSKTRTDFQLRMLIDAGADPNIKDAQGVPLIIRLAERGLEDNVSLLLEKPHTDPNARDPRGRSLIHVALHNHASTLVGGITSNPRFDPTVADENGNTPLHLAVLTRNPLAIICHLVPAVAARTNFEAVNNEGYSALHLALRDPLIAHSATVSPIIDFSNPNHKDPEGKTAVILAVEQQVFIEVLRLLTMGGDPESQDIFGQSAYDYAFEKGNQVIISAIIAAHGLPPFN